MLGEPDLSAVVAILDTMRSHSLARSAMLVHVEGHPLTRDWSEGLPEVFAAISAASFLASVEVAKLASRVPMSEVRVGMGKDVVLLRRVSRTVLLCISYDLDDTTHDMVALHATRAGAELAPILERYDTPRDDGTAGRLAPLRPGDPPRPPRRRP